MDSRKLWLAVLGELEVSVSRASFSTWFKNTAIISQEDGHIIVAVPNIFTKEWLEKKYHAHIKDSLTRMGTSVDTIEYKVTDQKSGPVAIVKDPLVNAVAQPSPPTTQSVQPVAIPTRRAAGTSSASQNPLNAKYTFDNYVVGSSNELAYAASQAVAKFPGDKYNPLFLYGGVGLGKTHLMQAIGNEIIASDPSKKVRYVTSEQFTREFLDSIQHKKGKSFADQYRSLDVLIVDDIQFLGNKEKTQEEFFHTFNTLHQQNKQIIMSSDKPPKAIPHLEDRLRSRFEWGMAADIQRPDLETRAAIVQRRALADGMQLPLELVEYLARHYQHNIRELEGALTQLIAYCEVRGIDPSMSVAKGLVGGANAGSRKRAISPKGIIDKTASYFDLQPSDIIGPRRDKDIVVPRQIAMYLMRHELNLSFPKIAANVGGRDHTTAMHSVQKIEKLIEVDEDLRSEVNDVKERITA